MTAKKKKAWFVRVGPFGGILPQTWQGFLVLLVGIPAIIGLELYSSDLSKAGDTPHSQMFCVAGIISGIVLYIFAAANSGRANM